MSNAFLEDEKSYRGRYQASVFETISICYRQVLWPILFVLVLGFLGRLALLANANIVGAWVDSYCQGESCRPPPAVFSGWASSDFVGLLGAVTLAGFLLTVSFRVFFSRLSAQAVSQLYDEVTYRTSRYEMSFFDRTPVGRIVTRFSSDYGSIFRIFGGPLAEFIGIIFDLLSVVVLMAIAGPAFLVVFAVMAFLNFLVYRWRREALRSARREVARSRSPVISHYSETVQGSLSVRVFGRQAEFRRRFGELNDAFVAQRLDTANEVTRFSGILALITVGGLVASCLLGVWLVDMGYSSVGSLGVAFAFVTVSAFSIQIFFEWMAQFEEALAGVERMDEYLRRPTEAGANLPVEARFALASDPPKAPVPEPSGSRQPSRGCALSVRNLSLSYSRVPGDDVPLVLKDVSFELAPGTILGVVGRTGSGKSSLIQALFHLYPFRSGEVLIDGMKASLDARVSDSESRTTISLDQFRAQIALVTQDPILLSGTVRENLDLSGTRTDAELREALAFVGLAEWGDSAGLARRVEERGRNISSGERQLICLARAFLQPAPLMILDEATASVDPMAEQIMMNATRSFFRGRTQIVVAHRLSTLEHCDLVLWLDQGRVRQLGPTADVLAAFRRAEQNTAPETLV